MRIAARGLADVCLVDVIEGWPKGLALDMRHSARLDGFDTAVIGTNDYSDIAGSDVVVITAGFPRGPGMSRMDLLEKNAEVVSAVAEEIRTHCPEAVVIQVTNPLDEMTFLAAERCGVPKSRVMGMAGLLDSARLAYYISEELGVSPLDVDALTLGSHGDQMVPLPRHATVGGQPLPELADSATLERVFKRTRDAGSEVVALLGKGSAFYAPSAAVVKMVEAVLGDTNQVMPVSAWVTGQYGVSDVYLGVPARVGAEGVEDILVLDLNDEELTQLREAAEAIREKCSSLGRWI
ncbi:MAG: malate dehydrogenase [Actinomycetota bacterium]|nr:malate dehydrogenase [Actinomycetota bacterium]